uniref:G_PROTEIN_RECEP_F1_2 domain-containing protein n=1 Tax=Rhabditophanes sp. KR3021 TaxID=114890 RepID=A0AC35U7W1_9BILA
MNDFTIDGNSNDTFLDSLNVTLNDTEGVNVLRLSYEAKTLAIFLYSMLSVVAFAGNLIIVIVILYFPRLRTGTNILILNLAVSDLLISLVCMPLSYWHVIIFDDQRWIFGNFFCKFFSYLQAVVVFSNSWTLVVISFDRCLAIMFVMSRWNRLNKRRAMIVSAVIWLISLLVASPLYLVHGTLKIDNKDFSCNEDFSRLDFLGINGSGRDILHIYSLLIFLLQYIIPLLVIICTYTTIGVKMWYSVVPGAQSISRCTRRSRSLLQERHESVKKLIPMVLIVSALYAGCWLPQNLLMNILVNVDPSILTHPYILYIWWIAHTIAMFHSVVNPFIYYLQNKRMREGFRYVLRYLPCVHFNEFKLLMPPNQQRTCCSQTGKVVSMVSYMQQPTAKRSTISVASIRKSKLSSQC